MNTKGCVTWLTPYWDLWQQHVGVMSGGRFSKAIRPAHDLLGPDRCTRAFRLYVTSAEPRKSPEWFAKDCVQWDRKASLLHDVPLVDTYGTLTPAGRTVYGG